MGDSVRPLTFGYLRLWPDEAADGGSGLVEEIEAFATREGMTLADVFTDPFDPAVDEPDRAGFCALMDALRRCHPSTVIVPSPDHLSRHPGGRRNCRVLIEHEAGARLHIVHAESGRP
ncbi:MAG: hypothetical protein DLM59_17205 [Pseudonocardiales bacterium]|nr:MAG: hypothetical protein DLM59_17205 [Pseudonocardiales bacterium]